MLNELLPSVAKATELPNNQFQLTRLRLTVIYAALLLTILIISSVITHSIFSSRLEHRFPGQPIPPPPQSIRINRDLRNQVRHELFTSLIFVNGILFISAVGLSYILAGITLRPIQQIYNRQRHFISDASHELRTPLAILQTDLENELANAQTSLPEKNRSKSHLEEVKQMSNIVNDLLFISQLDGADQLSVTTKIINLSKIIATAIQRLQKYAANNQVKITASPTIPQHLIQIKANPEHLMQAISNIIKNGIDYNKPNGQVIIDLKQTKNQAIIIISDTGIGIAANEIPRLFDRFYRVDQSRSRQLGGSGLGLSIVQSVIHNYSGTIDITSQPNHGTTVTLTFPLSQQ